MLAKDFSKRTYTWLLSALLLGSLGLLVLSESSSYWLATRYIRQHRKITEPLLMDFSGKWMWPRLPSAQVVGDSGLPLGIAKKHHPIWILEQRKTGLKASIPSEWRCESHHFGLLHFFRVRRCVPHNGNYVALRTLLKKSQILLDGRPCRWQGDRCRFGPSWKWAGPLGSFKSGGVLRSCTRVHPVRFKWLELHFPPTSMEGGLRLSFGFQDGKASDVPMTLQAQLRRWAPDHPKSPPQLIRPLMERKLDHRAYWHTHQWNASELNTSRPGSPKMGLTIRLWTQNEGAKDFCIEATAFQRPKKKGH